MDSFMGIMAIDYDLQLLRLEMKILYFPLYVPEAEHLNNLQDRENDFLLYL